MNTSIIQQRIQEETDDQILSNIALRESAFQEGVFTLYVEEAKQRGLEINEEVIQIKVQETKVRNVEEDGKRLVGIGFLLWFLLMGFFSFIPGNQLLKKDKSGNPIYSKKHRRYGMFFSLWSLGVFVLLAFVVASKIYHLFG